MLAWSRQCSSLKKCHVSMKQSYADRARDHKMVMMREGPSNEGQMLRSITYTFSISLGSKTNIFPIKSTIPYDPLDLRFRTNTTHSSPTRALAFNHNEDQHSSFNLDLGLHRPLPGLPSSACKQWPNHHRCRRSGRRCRHRRRHRPKETG